jgi:hypothetical protein
MFETPPVVFNSVLIIDPFQATWNYRRFFTIFLLNIE